MKVLIFTILECHQTLGAMMISYREWVSKPLFKNLTKTLKKIL